MQSKGRIPELDGLRTLMIFIVSWYHIWQQSWLRPMLGSYSLDYLVRSGYVWVDGTILLSSFLLFLPYAKAMREKTAAPDTRAFYYRRARRVLPAYWFIIIMHLVVIASPWGLYKNREPFLVKDLATHLTFTFTQFADTYIHTNLDGAAWTLAILVQGYVLFPLIAAGMRKKPVLTLGILCAVCFGFRAWCIWALTDYNMVVNQLINFLDVYTVGILAAMVYVRLDRKREEKAVSLPEDIRADERPEAEKEDGQPEQATPGQRPDWRKYGYQALATLVFIVGFIALLRMLRFQASSMDNTQIQMRQMIYRPVFALCFASLLLSAPFALLPLRKLLGNPVTKFLGGVSMNYYLIHQTVIVHLKRLRFPPSVSDMPNMAGEQPWQNQYTLVSFTLSLLLAVLVTYAIEKPAARLLNKLRGKKIRSE